MSRNTKLCVVCLRADRKLKIIDKRLSDFHVELCDYAVESTEPTVYQYCFECEYLLKKMYKFKAKCVLAIKILRDWKRSKSAGKKPVEMIYKLLPPSSLGLWSKDKTSIYMLTEIGLDRLDSTTEEGSKSNGSSFQYIDVTKETVSLQYYTDVNTEELEQESKHSKDGINYKCEETELEFNDPVYLKIEDSASDVTNNDNGCQSDEIASENDLKVNNRINDSEDDISTDVGLCDDNETHSDDSNQSHLIVKIQEDTKKPVAKLDNIISQNHDKDGVLKKVTVNKQTRIMKMTNATSKKRKSANIGDDDDDDDKEEMLSLDDVILKKANDKGFSKERLKAKVTEQFESCGELKTEDGGTIDKQLIMKCLDDKVTEHILKKLWNTIRGKSPKPSSRTLNLYKYIQDKFTSEYESVFDIEYLNTKKKMLEEFEKRKTYSCYTDAKYKCELCYQGFKHEKQFENHKKLHDKSAGDFVCSICNTPKKSKKTLKSHIHHTHGAIYKCKLCPFLTYYRYIMKNHFLKHKGEVYNCKPCGKIYKNRSSYYAHVGLRHNTQYVCTTCGHVYLTEVGLETHKARHQNEPTNTSDGVSCPQCELQFPSQSVLEKHLVTSHGTRVKKQQDATSTKTKTDSKRKQRARTKHTCRVCNAVGDSIGWLMLHFRMDHPDVNMDILYADKKPNLCDVCGRGFASVHRLRDHMKNHTGERPVACTVCPKRFMTFANMRNHRLWHFPPRQVCGVCGKKFHSTANLYNHIQIHIGNRRHKCSICDKGFIHRHALNEHVNGVHYNIKRDRTTRAAKRRKVKEPNTEL